MAFAVFKRLAYLVATMVVVSAIVFLLLEATPSNVAIKFIGPYTTVEQQQLWLEQNGYFRPVVERYGEWLARFAVGDFGESIRFKAPVAAVLWTRLFNTAVLAFTALAIIAPLSLFFGVLAGMQEGRPLDRAISFTSIVTTSFPEFASAVFLAGIFVFWLGWLPGTSGMADGWDARQLILPAAVLVVYDFGYVARMTRASMADVMAAPYVRTAVLKGLPYHRVITHHALRNALITPFTVLTLHINWLLSGVIVVESFFAYKGFGALLLEASLNQDIYMIEACAMVSVFVAVATQALADIGYLVLNPRMRAG
ncbi:MAG: ABC transporter permease [Alphaproteobacteria bacterium]|nr:ABC transporter permease [Alphaproteobacteria bacterium]